MITAGHQRPRDENGRFFGIAASLAERFDSKWIPEPNTGCWLWTAYTRPSGYGEIQTGRRGEGALLANRASWLLHRGPIPCGLNVLHKCDTPACVNPDHLFLGTQADNVHDMLVKGRENRLMNAKGEQHGMAKLSEEQVLAIRVATGKQRDIAREFGVTQATVCGIKAKKAWRHVL